MTNAMNTGIYGRVNPGPGFGDEYSYTDDVVLTAAQDGAVINNAGAAKAIELTLPQAFAGMEYAINRIAAFSIGVKPNPVDSIGGSSPGVTKRLFARGLTTFACFVDGTWETVIKADSGDRAINVLDYGVLADGVSDDGPAINAANDAAYAAKLPVFDPTGVYGVLTPVVIKAPMICAGGNSPRTNNLIPLYGTRFINLGITGASKNISAISVGATTTVTTSANHDLTTGDFVYISGISGTTQLNGVAVRVAVTGPTTFTLTEVDSTGFTAWSSGGTVLPVPAVIKVISDVAGSEVARGFRVDGGFAVDGGGYNCTGFYAPGVSGTNFLTRWRIQNLHVKGCTVGIAIKGYGGAIEQSYVLENLLGVVLDIGNAVDIIGGAYSPKDDPESWAFRLTNSNQVNFYGPNIQGYTSTTRGHGLDIAEGCRSIRLDSYLEYSHGAASASGYQVRVGGINSVGGATPANTLSKSVKGFDFGVTYSGAVEASAIATLGPKIHLGNVVGVDLGLLRMATKNLEISQYAKDVSGAALPISIVTGAAAGNTDHFYESHYTTDESGMQGRAARSFIPNPSGGGSVGAAIRGFSEIVLSTSVSVSAESSITRDGVSSIKVTRAAGTTGVGRWASFYPFGQAELIAATGTVCVSGWIYVPTAAAGNPNDCYGLTTANLRAPRVGIATDITPSTHALYANSGAAYIGYFAKNGWTRFFAFKSLSAFAGLTKLGIAVYPINDQAVDLGTGEQDHSIYLSDLTLTINPQSWVDLLSGRFSLDSRGGMFVGSQFVTSASAAPTNANTYWARGDTVLNSAPAVGAPDRWVCTTAGTGATAVFTPTANL